MNALSVRAMQDYLCKSISNFNKNKVNGLLAEIDFRNYLSMIGFQDRVSVGGWIARSKGASIFGDNTIVMFPDTILPDTDYGINRTLPNPTHGLHTICSTFHQIGLKSMFCASEIVKSGVAESVRWKSIRLGLPTQQQYEEFPNSIVDFNVRLRAYNFLRYGTKNMSIMESINVIPHIALAEEFSKENLRVCFQSHLLAEISDIDGILWGEQYTYPLEIKEKTVASDSGMGEYFGLDVGPFVKLAFYAARKGNLHSIFIVREIDNPIDRNLVNWWFIPFDRLASFASWVSMGGGTNMQGAGSTVVKIPKRKFFELNAEALSKL